MASELINDCRSEFPGRDFVLKEDVEFTICSVFRFGEPEERPDETQGREPAPEKAGLGAPIQLRRVEEIRHDDSVDDTDDDICDSSDAIDSDQPLVENVIKDQ